LSFKTETEVEESFSAKRHTQMESLSLAVCSQNSTRWEGCSFYGACSCYMFFVPWNPEVKL